MLKTLRREYQDATEFSKTLLINQLPISFDSKGPDPLEMYCTSVNFNLNPTLISTLAKVRTNSLFKPFQYVLKLPNQKQNFDCILCKQVNQEPTQLILHLLFNCLDNRFHILRNSSMSQMDAINLFHFNSDPQSLVKILKCLNLYRRLLQDHVYPHSWREHDPGGPLNIFKFAILECSLWNILERFCPPKSRMARRYL